MTWRSISQIRSIPGPTAIQFHLGDGCLFGFMPIGRGRTYGFNYVITEHFRGLLEGRLERLRHRLRNFGPRVQEYLGALARDDQVICSTMMWMEIKEWHAGRVVLVGDAAHASSPMMGQGGCMAMEDACVLADELHSAATVEDALASYVHRRTPRVEWVQRQNMGIFGGPECDVARARHSIDAGPFRTARAASSACGRISSASYQQRDGFMSPSGQRPPSNHSRALLLSTQPDRARRTGEGDDGRSMIVGRQGQGVKRFCRRKNDAASPPQNGQLYLGNGHFRPLPRPPPKSHAGQKQGAEADVAAPMAKEPQVLSLDKTTFCKGWNGEALLLRRNYKFTDETRPFGFAWFIPEILRNGATFRDIIVAAIMLQVLALALPIFMQITVDKVLVHQAYTTLYVLVAGVGLAILFDAAFNYLRRSLPVYASARIDVRTSTRTFERLLSLSIDFFERVSAGVITKHMQQRRSVSS
jgi:hypothetical protein